MAVCVLVRCESIGASAFEDALDMHKWKMIYKVSERVCVRMNRQEYTVTGMESERMITRMSW